MHRAGKRILIVDDDRTFCGSLRDHLLSEDTEVLVSHTAADCRDICSRSSIDVVLLDQKLPDGEGYSLCPSILNCNDQTKIIFMTAYPNFDNAVKAVKAGAFDYLSKPLELEELELAVRRAYRTIDLEKVEQFQRYRDERETRENVIIGGSGPFAQVQNLIDLAALSDAPVLITGETGSGKNVAAKGIHYRGPLRKEPFISINCAAIPESLIEAELFGYEKGAFTGATVARKGILEMAEGGTLLLDEIGEMPMPLQSKILGVLDDREIRRIGGRSVRLLNVRIIAATALDLEQAIVRGTFRKDLFYRLSVIKIYIPPLRERLDDLAALCDCLIGKIARGRDIRLSDAEIDRLKKYDWPGNVRELRNVLERAIILQKGPEIKPSDLLPTAGPEPVLADQKSMKRPTSLSEVEKEHIRAVLAEHSNNYSRAARAIGISLSTLKRKIRKYGIS